MIANSFMGTAESVGNNGCRSVISQLMHFRTQVTRKTELRAINGWGDPLNELLARGLASVRRTLALVTIDQVEAPADGTSETTASAGQGARQRQAEAKARNEHTRLKEIWESDRPITADDIQMPASHGNTLPYDFSGANPNWPQMTATDSDGSPIYQNTFLIQFVDVIDQAVRDTSNLACAKAGDTVPADESAMIHARLDSAFAILQAHGGEVNRPKIADGTDPDLLAGKVGPQISPQTNPSPNPNTATNTGTPQQQA